MMEYLLLLKDIIGLAALFLIATIPALMLFTGDER